jgi:phenylalanyl-tRNA synthetase beta subunit
VKPSTTELLLESANFEPATIRRAATAMGLSQCITARRIAHHKITPLLNGLTQTRQIVQIKLCTGQVTMTADKNRCHLASPL